MDKPQVHSSPTTLQQTLGEKVTMLRKRKQWTQAKLAELTNNSANTIRRLERGGGAEMAAGRLLTIAQTLGVSLDYLFGQERVQ